LADVQPDVLAARFDELTDKNLPAATILAVEVLSPSGRLIDLDLKRAHYQRLGTPSYWVLDPDIPDLLVLDLGAEGQFQEVVWGSMTRFSRRSGHFWSSGAGHVAGSAAFVGQLTPDGLSRGPRAG
jgi:Putative restriction endonuclease